MATLCWQEPQPLGKAVQTILHAPNEQVMTLLEIINLN
jgi:hypothetical protein